MKKENHDIYFNTRDELTKVCLDDVMYVTSDGNYICVKFKTGRELTLLANLQNFLQAAESVRDVRFVRIGRSHVINLAYVYHINTVHRSITMINEDNYRGSSIELVVPREAIRQLKMIITESPRRDIPNFQTTNGHMEAFQVIDS